MSETGSSTSHNRRQLRERKQKKLYLEEWALGDDDMEGIRGFSVAEKLESSKFAQTGMVREMKGSDLSVAFLQQYGFNIPLLFREKSGLGLRMPPSEFDVQDVRLCVGSRRVIDVMDVNTQKNLQMTMKEWQQYYEDPQKTRLLNVISLEFSHTRLDEFIQSPDIVRQIDWVDVVWPKQLKDAQKESTNLIGDMMYPKVQKYCLMSVKNCYTDFHIDFGGTSVWYHILKGSKVFWLIPPTEKNLQLYEKWVLSGKQSDIFFGDTVDKCARVYLTAGNTFFIPTGWIHAVYTPTESLVFGGNFLHSFGIVKQLKTAQVEDNTKVPQKFRYPFFTEMLWYVLAKYVYTLLGRSHLEGEESLNEDGVVMTQKDHIHLTHYELFGLKEIVMYLYDLPPQKKNVPDLVRDPVALIKDVRTLVERHCRDKPELAITGEPVLKPPPQQIILNSNFPIYNRFKMKEQIKAEISQKNEELLLLRHNSMARNSTTICSSSQSGDRNTGSWDDIKITKNIEKNISPPPPSNGYADDDVAAVSSTNVKSDILNFISPTVSCKSRARRKLHSNSSSLTAISHSAVDNASGSGPEGGGGGGGVVAGNYSGMDGKNNQVMTASGQPRRRRTRCKNCAACQRSDCGECSFCLDMVKFGGPGRAKQTCMMRQCLSPMLPVTAQCIYCHLDGWRQTPVSPQAKFQGSVDGPSTLMECSVCYEIAHPDCAQNFSNEMKGIVNEDLPNSWECPTCCKTGKNNDYKPRHFRARLKSSEVRRTSVSSDANSSAAIEGNRQYSLDTTTSMDRENGGGGNGGTLHHSFPSPTAQCNDFFFTSESEKETTSTTATTKSHCATNKRKMQVFSAANIKSEGSSDLYGFSDSGVSLSNITKLNRNSVLHPNDNSHFHTKNTVKRRKSDDGGGGGGGAGNTVSSSNTRENIETPEITLPRKKNSIRSQIAQQILNSSTRVLKKPQYVVRPANFPQLYSLSNSNLALDPNLLKMVFRYLSPESLVTCCSVCKIWSNVSVDPDLWKIMNCTEHKLSASLLTAIVRRQPEHLILDWTQIAKRQLAWVIARLPALKNLSLQNCPIQAVLALHTCLCPPLQILDLSFVRGLNDGAVRDILSPPKDSRPGLTDSKSRLRNLKTLKIAGTDISDVAVRYITQGLPTLKHLDLSSCQRVTDAGVAQIGTCVTTIKSLTELNLSACRLITELSLEHLSKCEELIWLDLRHVPQVPTQAVIKFAAKSKHDLCVKDIKLVEKRRTS